MPLTMKCLTVGHDDRVRYAKRRIFLECAECGRTTAGWDLNNEQEQAEVRDTVPLWWRRLRLLRAKRLENVRFWLRRERLM